MVKTSYLKIIKIEKSLFDSNLRIEKIDYNGNVYSGDFNQDLVSESGLEIIVITKINEKVFIRPSGGFFNQNPNGIWVKKEDIQEE